MIIVVLRESDGHKAFFFFKWTDGHKADGVTKDAKAQ